MTRRLVVTLAALSLLAPAAAQARPQTTLSQTIADRDGDNRLEPAPGEDYRLRDDLGTPSPGRARTREEKVFFGQLTDIHVIDEESPLRVEFLDKFGPPLTSAYRPQESLSTQVLDESVKQMRNTVSPVSHHGIDLLITTGDSADNTQLNETRWMIDLLDGHTTVDPDSGRPGACGGPGRRYQGVRDQGEYYEPDASGPPGANTIDGPGYSPYEEDNLRAAPPRASQVRDYPGLFERANEPFRATGLDVPWYSAFGNHDALIQGNQPRDPAFEDVAVGCVKTTGPSGGVADLLGDPSSDPDKLLAAAIEQLKAKVPDPASVQTVQADERRKPLRKAEWIAEHFETGGTPAGHGFAENPEAAAVGMGNYAFSPRPGLRFVVLDTINEGGGDGGNVDDPQFRWLDGVLAQADTDREIVLTFAHHTLETMDQQPFSPFPPGDTGGTLTPAVHYGLGPEGKSSPCPPPPSSAAEPLESVRCLFLRHRSVVAFVNGHTHSNNIEAFGRNGSDSDQANGGFWQINTASHIDWPQQSRTIDVFDNHDSTLSLFGTILDHAAAPNPGGAQASSSTSRLASISRELSFNDPDSQNGENSSDARGTPDDRNVELGVRNPFPAP